MLSETYFAATNSEWYLRISTPKVVIIYFERHSIFPSNPLIHARFELSFGIKQMNVFCIGIIAAFSSRPETREMRDDSTMAVQKRARADFDRKGDHISRNVSQFLNFFGV